MATIPTLEQVLAEREHLAEEILINKQMLIDFDRKRNANREGLNQWKKTGKMANEKKAWIQFGDMFVRLPSDTAKKMIEKDQESLNKTMDETRDSMREATMKLQEMEGSKKMAGFDLKSLRARDVYNL
ncbi:hypothetical protein CLU79DRAFT_771951 [Phycomyces nitens]|nr:hypothetical protein CLU79DRAFT_771951 [Phycomyces nitens]